MAITNVGGGFNDKKALCFSLALPFCNAKSVSINSCSPTNEKKKMILVFSYRKQEFLETKWNKINYGKSQHLSLLLLLCVLKIYSNTKWSWLAILSSLCDNYVVLYGISQRFRNNLRLLFLSAFKLSCQKQRAKRSCQNQLTTKIVCYFV